MTEPITPNTHRTLYLAGPMSGIENFNYPAFGAAAERLRGLGFCVLNPARDFGGDTTRPYNDYMRLAFAYVLRCNAVALLPGWEASRGAGMETTLAGWLGLPLVSADTLLPVCRGCSE